jgi:hypothetical protein
MSANRALVASSPFVASHEDGFPEEEHAFPSDPMKKGSSMMTSTSKEKQTPTGHHKLEPAYRGSANPSLIRI